MKHLQALVLLVIMTASGMTAAGPDSTYRAPRAHDGHPDLQGVWNFASGVPLQRRAAFGDRTVMTKEEFDKQRAALLSALSAAAKFAPVENVGFDWIDFSLHVDDLRTSLITHPDNGRLPALVDGVRRVPTVEDIIAALTDPRDAPTGGLPSLLAAFGGSGKRDSHQDFNMAARCLSGASVPFQPGVGDNYVQIIQAGDTVVLLTDEFRRIIALDGKARVGEKLRSWSGLSTGRWDRDTLVVETRHFDGRAPSFAGAGSSRDKVVTERFTRTSAHVIEYAATVVDPTTFQDTVALSFPMAQVDARLYESACHEGNYSMANTLSGARKDEETRKTP
jgi:hypothetical protein